MNLDAVEKVANALLYEGYLLYPYRPSSVKNRQRWTFGGLYPRAWSATQVEGDAWEMQTQCLIQGDAPTLSVRVRFLHLVARTEPATSRDAWQEAIEREVAPPAMSLLALLSGPREIAFSFQAALDVDGALERRREAISGAVTISADRLADGLFRATIRIRNTTPFDGGTRDDALLRALVSTHTLLGARDGEFVSLLEPLDDLRAAAEACKNIGTWPVLVGAAGARDTMLSSPIIVYDYPEIAPESPGDLFDATEIDEILTLRILTMTDEEKREMRAVDGRARTLLERTEDLTRDDMMRLHGAMRSPRDLRPPPEPGGDEPPPSGLRPGARVRLRPRGRADVFDILLAGKAATISAVERDYEGRVHVAVTIDDDPGQDLGAEGRPGHRFYFGADEIELEA